MFNLIYFSAQVYFITRMSSAKDPNTIHLKPFFEGIFPKSYFTKTGRGWLRSPGILLLLLMATIFAGIHIYFIWYLIQYFTIDTDEFLRTPVRLLAIFYGQFAIVTFSLEFILSTRLKFIERLFGGLDKVYRVHSIIGRVAFLFVCVHVALMFGEALFKWSLPILRLYLVPGAYLPYTFGLWAFLFLLFVITTTIWINLPYKIWYQIHKLLGVSMLFAGLHAWNVQPEYSMFTGIRVLFTIIWTLGVIAFFYKLLLYRVFGPSRMGTIIRTETRGTITDLYIKLSGKMTIPHPGEFVFLQIKKSTSSLPSESHPFSISGAYAEDIIRLSIKELGDYTAKIRKLTNGDHVKLYGPYGTFGRKFITKSDDMIWIAGGIGITPFLFMSQHFVHQYQSGMTSRTIDLFWSIRNKNEAIYINEFEKYAQSVPQFYPHFVFTDQTGYLTAESIVEQVGGIEIVKNRTIMLCGPAAMMHSLSKQFLDLGISEKKIIFEEFQL